MIISKSGIPFENLEYCVFVVDRILHCDIEAGSSDDLNLPQVPKNRSFKKNILYQKHFFKGVNILSLLIKSSIKVRSSCYIFYHI